MRHLSCALVSIDKIRCLTRSWAKQTYSGAQRYALCAPDSCDK